MSAAFPTALRIALHDFKVEDWDIKSASIANRYGECDNLEKTLRVCRAHGERKAAETLFHEMLHAIFTEWVIEDDDKEERVVSTMAAAVCTVWRDNPEAFEWMRASILGEPT